VWKRLTCAIDITNHRRGNINGEEVIAARGRMRIQELSRSTENSRIGEEANTSNKADLDMEPTASQIRIYLVVSNQKWEPRGPKRLKATPRAIDRNAKQQI
jgi:hypothetical protein